MSKILIYTIGFTQKTAERFFTELKKSRAKQVIDIRLNNVSQLAGFAKRDDLRYFLREICGIDYIHVPELAPTKEILELYRKEKNGWNLYRERYIALLTERKVERAFAKEMISGGCLLCSEASPDHCHRRLAAEYFIGKWGEGTIRHIL
jgi:uncharacterized protein (DUF488 family)